jgi:very-short-patch-repair endonuclease
MTLAEKTLWRELQQRWKLEFQTQAVVGSRFVADFVCWKKKLIIEVDGSIHQLARIKAKDKYRTRVLNKLGYRVIRFTNNQVMLSTTRVLRIIEEELLR